MKIPNTSWLQGEWPSVKQLFDCDVRIQSFTDIIPWMPFSAMIVDMSFIKKSDTEESFPVVKFKIDEKTIDKSKSRDDFPALDSDGTLQLWMCGSLKFVLKIALKNGKQFPFWVAVKRRDMWNKKQINKTCFYFTVKELHAKELEVYAFAKEIRQQKISTKFHSDMLEKLCMDDIDEDADSQPEDLTAVTEGTTKKRVTTHNVPPMKKRRS